MNEEIEHLQLMRDKYQHNVWKLKEEAAEFGNTVPLNLANELEDEEAKLAAAEKELAAAQARAAAAPPVAVAVSVTTNVNATVTPMPSQPAAGVAAPSEVPAPQPMAAPQSPPPSQAAPPNALPRIMAGFPTTPRFLVLYVGIALMLLPILLIPFVKSDNEQMNSFSGLLFLLGFIIVVGVLLFMLAQYLVKRGK